VRPFFCEEKRSEKMLHELLSGSTQSSMSRDSRSKPTNVVKSRSAPSLLGGFAAARTKEHLPSNRFIELGDIALGNSKRHERHMAMEVVEPEPEVIEQADSSETAMLPEIAVPPKPPRLRLPRPRLAKPPKQVASSPFTRPKPPKPPTARPKLPLPPKNRLPKLPKIERPKPFAPGRNTPTGRSR